MLVLTAAIAGRRIAWLVKLIRSGRQAPGRWDGIGERLRAQLVEVFGQRRLLRWSAPGLAHFFTFWGFVILFATIVEAYGALVISQDFAFPFFGHARWLGFLEDFFAVAVLLALAAFAIMRLRQAPARRQRESRFYGSHTRPAWVILGMITLVIVTLLLYRGAQYNTGHFPWGRSKAPFASYLVSRALGDGAYNQGVETFFLLGQMAVVFGFTILVVYSKHLHIALAPVNVSAKRLPDGLGPLLPVADAEGKPIDFADVENLSEDTLFGKGKIEDFTWKGYLDFATCTECGRCQSQCPAWNTGKPLSPKLVIMDLRDHLFAKAPYLIEGKPLPSDIAVEPSEPHTPESGFGRVPGSGPDQAVRPLVGDLASGGVIDPDVLWSCTMCGACVEQCPVDIEHLFWVGCAGALEDRSRKVTRAFAELLHIAGVEFAILGSAETCTGDPARRLGNEFLFQMQGMQNVETLNSITRAAPLKIVATCPHCFNTLANEYPQIEGHFDVVHHTQLLARLVDEGRLTPVEPIDKKVTYHDPCYLGRHNKVYTPPREVLGSIPALRSQEMHRCKERGFCCGAGGARMWMEEKIGKRVNIERTEEALGLDPDLISTACPFCMVMLTDAVTAKQADGSARDDVAVLDGAQILRQSLAAPQP